MYKRLKDKYIIHQSSYENMLIDIENESQLIVSRINSILFSMLDGTKTEEDIFNNIKNELNVMDEVKINNLKTNIKKFFEKYSKYIDDYSNKSIRKNFVQGDLNLILPHEIGIELTNKCLLKCIHCYKCSSPSLNDFVNYNDVISFLNGIKGKVYGIQLTGGEPMLHKNFNDLLKYCKQNFNSVSISTTGLLINKMNVKNFIGTHVYISLYDFNNEKNDTFINLKNATNKILESIDLLIKNKIHVCINTIATDSNCEELEVFINKCKELGAQGVGIGKISKVGRGKNLCSNLYCSESTCTMIKKYDEKYYDKFDDMYVSTFSDSLEHIQHELRCGLYKWYINEYGEITPCTFFPRDKFVLCNIKEYNLDEILNIKKINDIKEKLRLWKKELLKENIKLEDICPSLKLVDNND